MRNALSHSCVVLLAGALSLRADASHSPLRPDPLFRSGHEQWNCGNGVVEDAEQCDGVNVEGEDCLTLGFLGGDLSCDLGCRFDTAKCIANRGPIAGSDQVVTNEDVPIFIPVASLLANDADPDGDPLTIVSTSNALNGVAAMLGGFVHFTPAANFNGIASFEYVASDGDLTAVGLVTVLVAAVNDAPVAIPGNMLVLQNSSGSIATLSATDVDSASVSFEIVAQPLNGSLGAINTTGSFTAWVVYTPEFNYVGADSFSYRVFDGSLHSPAVLITVEVLSLATARGPVQ